MLKTKTVNPHLENKILELGIELKHFCFNSMLKLWYYKLFAMSINFKREFNRHLEKFADKTTFCAQIRMGGERKEFSEREMNPKNASSAFWSFIRQEFIKNMRPEQYRLFITSDSEEVMSEAVKEFESDQLITTPGLFLHLDLDRHPKHSCLILVFSWIFT